MGEHGKNKSRQVICVFLHELPSICEKRKTWTSDYLMPQICEHLAYQSLLPRGWGAHEVGGRAPHPREQGVGPLAFIFGDDFSLFILRYSVEFQDFWSCAE